MQTYHLPQSAPDREDRQTHSRPGFVGQPWDPRRRSFLRLMRVRQVHTVDGGRR